MIGKEVVAEVVVVVVFVVFVMNKKIIIHFLILLFSNFDINCKFYFIFFYPEFLMG